MSIRRLAGLPLFAAVLVGGTASTTASALASSTFQGKCSNYTHSCAPATKISSGGQVIAALPAGKVSTGGGGTYRAPSAASVTLLPRTGGGGAPASPDGSLMTALAGAALSILGFGIRRRFR
ncbi:MAG: hypothetical protein NVSMB22_19510 [Chloroflexota bacterium]